MLLCVAAFFYSQYYEVFGLCVCFCLCVCTCAYVGVRAKIMSTRLRKASSNKATTRLSSLVAKVQLQDMSFLYLGQRHGDDRTKGDLSSVRIQTNKQTKASLHRKFRELREPKEG